MQMYIRGSADAAALYCRAFSGTIGTDYRNPDGSCFHTEIDIGGQILAISEAPADMQPGTGMQFCLHYHENEADRVTAAYAVLREGAQIVCPLGPCAYSPHMFSLVDRFGVYWCLFS